MLHRKDAMKIDPFTHARETDHSSTTTSIPFQLAVEQEILALIPSSLLISDVAKTSQSEVRPKVRLRRYPSEEVAIGLRLKKLFAFENMRLLSNSKDNSGIHV